MYSSYIWLNMQSKEKGLCSNGKIKYGNVKGRRTKKRLCTEKKTNDNLDEIK